MPVYTVLSPNTIQTFTDLQSAVNSCPRGGVVKVSQGYTFIERLTIPRAMKIEGENVTMLARPSYQDGGWGVNYNYGQSAGSVLVFTATDGNALDFTNTNEDGLDQSLTLSNLAIIGIGAAGVTGLAYGSAINRKGRIRLDDVYIGNFATGLAITNVYSGSIRDLVVCGCDTGVKINGNALVLDSVDIRSCGTGIQLETANSIHIHGGEIQSCQQGIHAVQATECSVGGVYFESNSNYAIRLESTANHNKIDRCHYSTATDAIQIEGANNRVEMADISSAPIVLNGQSNVLYDAQYGSPQVTLGQFGNYREFILPMTYANVSRFLMTVEGGSAARDGLYIKGFDILAMSNSILYKVTPGVIPL